jgi:hypothetical protein
MCAMYEASRKTIHIHRVMKMESPLASRRKIELDSLCSMAPRETSPFGEGSARNFVYVRGVLRIFCCCGSQCSQTQLAPECIYNSYGINIP